MALTLRSTKGSPLTHNEHDANHSEAYNFLASGTGATSRTVRDKLRDVVSVKDFGAAGDGVTDDSAAIQSAIDVLEAGRGGVIYCPDAEYNLGAVGITIGAGEHGIRIVGAASGFTNDEGPATTEFAYSGAGNAIEIGGASARTDYCAIENIVVNIAGAGAAASCLKAVRTQQLGLVNSVFLTSQGAAAATGQTAIILDGGADFSAYTYWQNSKIRGDFTKGIVTQNGTNNAMTFIGGSILQTCAGTPAGTIGFDHATGNSSTLLGIDLDGWDTGARFGDDRNTIICRFESGGNTVDIEFAVGADKNVVFGGIFDPTKVTNNGTSNLVLSPDQFVFRESGKLGFGTGAPDYAIDIRHATLAEQGIKANSATGIARLILENTDRAWDLRCHSTDNFMIRDGTAGVTVFELDTSRNTMPGPQSAISTTASDGFLYVRSCAGTPTGTPTAKTGMAPIVIDSTNNKLYFYSGGAWRDAGP